jgi:outer membrane protein assembly factor BamB
MKRPWTSLRQRMVDESGGSLAPVLIAVGVGVLLISPFLAHVSTRMLAARSAEDSLGAQYAGDSGVEYTIWLLANNVGGFRTTVQATPLVPIAVPAPLPAQTVNQIWPALTATAISESGWTSLSNAPAQVRWGGSLTAVNSNTIYGFRGDATRTFWRYDIGSNSWSGRADTPADVREGGALAYDGANYIYALRGDNSSGFWRYRISDNTWSTLADTPAKIRGGGSLVYAGGYLYALRGNKKDDFWRYDIGSNSWSSLANAPENVGDGGALVYTGGSFLYALRGDKLSDFWRYSIASNTWTSLSSAPDKVDAGGSLIYNGSGTLFAIGGNKSTNFWSYDIAANAWSVEESTPGNVNDGGALAFPAGGDYLYAFQGDRNDSFWRHKAVPPKFDIVSQAETSDRCMTTTVRVEFSGTQPTVLFWTIDDAPAPCP